MKKNKPKVKKTFYLCSIDEFSKDILDIQDEDDLVYMINDSDEEDLKSKGIIFLNEIPDTDEEINSWNDSMSDPSVLRYRKLSDLIMDYMTGFEGAEELYESDDDTINNILVKRENSLGDNIFVIGVNNLTKRISLVKKETLIACTNSLHRNHRVNKLSNTPASEIPDNYLEKFNEQVLKCMGNFEKGTMLFYSDYRNERWDVNNKNNTIKMGVEESQNMFFTARLINLYCEDTVCTLRVFTNEKIGTLPAIELYIFVIKNDYTIQHIKHEDVLLSHTTDNRTGKKIEVEPNVIYCDVFGGKSFV